MKRLFFLLSIVLCFNLSAQVGKMIKNGDRFFSKGDFRKAANWYNQAFKEDEENEKVNLQLAYCYIQLNKGTKANEHLDRVLEKTEKPANEVLYAKARSLHLTHQLNEAKVYYKKSDPYNTNKKEIVKRLKECDFGIKHLASPKKFKIKNLPFNSREHDIAPKITADFKAIFFTSQRNKTEYPEDIYVALNRGGGWSSAANIGAPLSSEVNDACIGLSPDGQTMYVYKGVNGGDIYESELKGKKWSKPKPMSFNTTERETSICISPDGKTLYFVRQTLNDKGEKVGNSNIYICRKNASNKWSKPTRLNGNINTPYDEESPFIHPDGKTLYFSSKGHSSMGGYDIFKSTLNGSTWSKPVNLGYPLNTAADERNFVLSANAKFGFYAAEKEKGGKGGLDIYMITMPPGKKPALALLKGKVKDEFTGKAIEAKITVTDNEKNQIVAEFHSNSETGEYLIPLPSGKNYAVTIEKEGHLFHSENVYLNPKKGFKSLTKDIKLVNVKPGSSIVLNNIFFQTASFELSPNSYAELNKLADVMKRYPKMKVQISGHTDNRGDEQKNVLLSENRAKSVVTYLANEGIGKSRMKYIGHGSSIPVADNETSFGRRQNRRTEFEILE